MRPEVLIAFLAMAAVSYLIRVAGFLVGGRLHGHPRLRTALYQLPAAILIALVAPKLLHGGPAEWTAAAVVVALASRKRCSTPSSKLRLRSGFKWGLLVKASSKPLGARMPVPKDPCRRVAPRWPAPDPSRAR